MHLNEAFDVYYILIFSHNTHAADTTVAPFTIALIVQVRLKRSGLEALMTSHAFSRVSSLLSHTTITGPDE